MIIFFVHDMFFDEDIKKVNNLDPDNIYDPEDL